MSRLRLTAVAGIVLTAAVLVAAAGAGHSPPGFKTSQAAMLDCPTCKSVTPIITVGETLPGTSYRFEAIPDGIALVPGKRGDDDDDDRRRTAEILVNHETSTVPFQGLNDFDNSQLSRITLNTKTAGVLSGFFAIPSSANYQRFCSNFMATKEHGFSRPMLFTNEEATDFVNRTGTAFPGTPGEQAGVVVAYDPRNGQYKSIYGMGRHNHENSVALPGYKKPVILSGDDTFSAPASQLYMYLAKNADEVWNDQGSLWAFKSDVAAINDYGDLSGERAVSGTFIPVPRDIALGGQTGLENWSNANNVFQFIRLEDIAYDRKKSNVVYMADTGEPRAIPDPDTGRLKRQTTSTPFNQWSNGRIFKFVFDKKNPKIVKSLSILIDGDARGVAGIKALDLIHQPDNLETRREQAVHPGGSGQSQPLSDRRRQRHAGADSGVRPQARDTPNARHGQPGRRRGPDRRQETWTTTTRPGRRTGARGSRAASSMPRASSARGRSWSTSRRLPWSSNDCRSAPSSMSGRAASCCSSASAATTATTTMTTTTRPSG